MIDVKKRIMGLVEKYAGASRADEMAGARDAPMTTLKRHYNTLTTIRADIEREVDALIAQLPGGAS